MHLTVARTITLIVVFLFSLRVFGATVPAFSMPIDQGETIHLKNQHLSSIFGSLVFEKTEEVEERTAGESDHFGRIMLIDFSRLAISLCLYHLPQFNSTVLFSVSDASPPLHQVNCVFQI